MPTEAVKKKVALKESPFEGKTFRELEEVIVVLESQERHHSEMAIKARGSIEVLRSLITEGPKTNGEAVSDS